MLQNHYFESKTDFIKRIKKNKLDLIIFSICYVLFITLCIYLTCKFEKSFTWWYIAITSIVFFLYVLNKVLYNDKKSGRLSNLLEYQEKIDTLLGELKYVKAENSTLKENNNDLKCQIHYLENTIKEFEERGLEMKYVEILKLLQLLNISTERLPDSIQDIKTTLQFELNRVFDTYGYKMVEYSSETTSFYDVDYQPIDNPQLNVRAIINKDNNIAVKGKIYLPMSYGKNIK